MASCLSVRRIICADGERSSVLLDSTTGIPLYYPNLYATTQVRNRSLSDSTLKACLETLKLLYVYMPDLDVRFSKGEYLSQIDVEQLVDRCSYQMKELVKPEEELTEAKNIHFLEGARMKVLAAPQTVTKATKYNRLTHISKYLKWLAHELRRVNLTKEEGFIVELMCTQIDQLRPANKHSKAMHELHSLPSEDVTLITKIIASDSPDNPFHESVRLRNELIIKLLYETGMRRGELLNLKIDDFEGNLVVIRRRPDDKSDKRKHKPNVKTLGRTLRIPPYLEDLYREYILKSRSKVSGARREPFVFVVHKVGPTEGQPMTHKALDNIFIALRKKINMRIHPHRFRHTWNDRFSEIVDSDPELRTKESLIRSYQMGWKQGSGSAEIYNKRHVLAEAQKAAIRLQTKSPNLMGDGDE